MNKFIGSIEEFISKQDKKIRQKVRNKAVKKAEKNLIMHGRKKDDLTPEEWSFVIADEEKELWNRYQKGGLAALVAIMFWLP